MAETQFVYVVEQGCYSDRGVNGVYASAEAAMQAYPGEEWEPYGSSEPGAMWGNDKDWDEHLTITRHELLGLQSAGTRP